MQKLYLVVICVLALSLESLCAKSRKHRYSVEDEVPFFVNKIGPYQNPSETYEFYSLPFCKPANIQHKHLSIGEDLKGDHKVSSLYDIRFRGTNFNEPPLSTTHEFILAFDNFMFYL